MTTLTMKQRLFVAEYLRDLNATAAAVRAGYSRKTARQMGAENLSKPDIAQAIAKAMEHRASDPDGWPNRTRTAREGRCANQVFPRIEPASQRATATQ